MPTFKYKAISRENTEVVGVIEAYDELTAIDKIKENCPVVSSIAEVEEKKPSILQMEIGSKKIKLKELAILCSQFAIALKAGLPVTRAVRMMAIQTKDKKLSKLLKLVADDVENGYGLAQSFENKGKDQLPNTFVETVRAGEESGTLEHSFERLHEYFQKQSKVKTQVKSAMMYPVFLMVLAVIVVGIVLGVAMPVFTNLFADMNIELPGITLALMNIANFFKANGLVILLVLLALALAAKVYTNTEKGRIAFSKLKISLPILGDVEIMKAASQFANTLSTLIASGLPLIRSVQVASRVLDNYYIANKLGASVPKLEEGRPLGEVIAECKCFPEMLVEMTAMGEETGSLEETLQTIGSHFDDEVNTKSSRALSLLQPIITVFMGLIIGTVVIALYLPMFTMYGGI